MKHIILFYLILNAFTPLAARKPKAAPRPVTIQIAVTSDVHGIILPWDFINNRPDEGSLSRVSTYARRMRANADTAFILLDNGDILQGQPVMDYYNQIKADTLHVCAQVMNHLQYDAATVGNHDIECGHAVYDRLRSEFQFPWLAGNVMDTATTTPFFQPYTLIERQGKRIAIIGITTPGVPEWLPYSLWSGLRFDDMFETATRLVKEVKAKHSPDAIVGLFHSGIDATYGGQKETDRFNHNASLLIARKVEGFDVVICGHDHKPVNYSITNDFKQSVTIVNPGSHSRYFGVVNLTISTTGNQSTSKLVSLKDLPDDPVFNQAFNPHIHEVKTYLSRRIGHLATPLNINEALFGDCDFLDLIHRVQLNHSGADISMAEPMALNVKADTGAICLNDLFKIYKYSNTLYTLSLTGNEVDRFLEYAATNWFNQMKSPGDALLNITTENRLSANAYNLSSAEGIRYTVDVTRPAGDRVTITQMTDGRPFDPQATYKVAMSSYRANGGGGHLTQGVGLSSDELAKRVVSTSKEDYRDLLMHYIEQQGTLGTMTNHNWHIEPATWVDAARKKDATRLKLK